MRDQGRKVTFQKNLILEAKSIEQQTFFIASKLGRLLSRVLIEGLRGNLTCSSNFSKKGVILWTIRTGYHIREYSGIKF